MELRERYASGNISSETNPHDEVGDTVRNVITHSDKEGKGKKKTWICWVLKLGECYASEDVQQ